VLPLRITGVLGRERFSDGKGLAIGRERAGAVALVPEHVAHLIERETFIVLAARSFGSRKASSEGGARACERADDAVRLSESNPRF
jgi:hypothetical protein